MAYMAIVHHYAKAVPVPTSDRDRCQTAEAIPRAAATVGRAGKVIWLVGYLKWSRGGDDGGLKSSAAAGDLNQSNPKSHSSQSEKLKEIHVSTEAVEGSTGKGIKSNAIGLVLLSARWFHSALPDRASPQ